MNGKKTARKAARTTKDLTPMDKAVKKMMEGRKGSIESCDLDRTIQNTNEVQQLKEKAGLQTKAEPESKKQSDEAFYAPELFIKEYRKLESEKRAELGVDHLTPEQNKEIILSIFENGMDRPTTIDD